MYDSSVLIRELHCLETTLRRLRSPPSHEQILPSIDRTKAG